MTSRYLWFLHLVDDDGKLLRRTCSGVKKTRSRVEDSFLRWPIIDTWSLTDYPKGDRYICSVPSSLFQEDEMTSATASCVSKFQRLNESNKTLITFSYLTVPSELDSFHSLTTAIKSFKCRICLSTLPSAEFRVQGTYHLLALQG